MYAKANVLFNVHWNNVCCQQTPFFRQVRPVFCAHDFIISSFFSFFFFFRWKHVRIIHWIAFCFHKWNMHSIYALSPIKLNEKMFKFLRHTLYVRVHFGISHRKMCGFFFRTEKKGIVANRQSHIESISTFKGTKGKTNVCAMCIFTRKIVQWRQWNRNTNNNEKKTFHLTPFFCLIFSLQADFHLANLLFSFIFSTICRMHSNACSPTCSPYSLVHVSPHKVMKRELISAFYTINPHQKQEEKKNQQKDYY